jgi:integrase
MERSPAVSKEKLTKRSVEQLAVKKKDYIVFDSDLPGFGIRVMPSGKRFFLIQYRRHGRTRRVMLGQFGPVTAEIARKNALRLLGNVRGGDGDPAAIRDQERQSATVKELGARFLKEHVAVRCKPTTQAEYKRSVELFINPFFGNQRARTVTTADVADLHGTYAHIPYQANRTLGVLSKMMNLAETWGIRDKHTNPCEDIARYPEHKRERFLSAKEMRQLGEILRQGEANGTESKYAVAAFRLLLLTGCRLSEIQTLKWDYVDLDESEINLPDSKTGAKTVHLGEAARTVLEKLPHVKDNPYVIVGNVEGNYLTDLQKPWRRVRKAAGLDGVRIHDLRHTFASGGLLVGEGLPMIGKLLGHTQVQTTARYAHLADDPVKAAATRISGRLAAALG